MKTRPVGGRGKTTPYHDKQVKIPLPILNDILEVRQRYWDYLAEGGDPHNPPSFLDLSSKNSSNQPDNSKYSQEFVNSYLIYLESTQHKIKDAVNNLHPSPSKDYLRRLIVDLFNNIHSILMIFTKH